MSIINRLKLLRDSYMARQIEKNALPDFHDAPVVRRHLLFAGHVQGVGFRFEVMCLAERLGVSGWVRNLPDGRVEAEVQGSLEKIEFLVQHMRELKRAFVESVRETEKNVILGENGFCMKN